MAHALGLRGKSVLALCGTCVLVLLLASVVGWQAVKTVRSRLGAAFARNLTLLNRERILAPVSRELALSLRFAGSQAIRRWFLDEDNEATKALAMQEAEGYRRDFMDQSYFLVSALSGNYYFNDTKAAPSPAPRYQLRADDPHDAWFFNTLQSDKPFNINVDPDVKLGVTKVWFNVIVRDGERKIGVAGTGLDLSTFLRAFVNTTEPGVTPMIVDANGAIQAHPDSTRIAFNSGTEAASHDKSLYSLLERAADVAAARAALAVAATSPGSAAMFSARLQGKDQLWAVSSIPELQWQVLTAVDLDVARVIDTHLLLQLTLTAAALLAVAGLGFVYATNRLVLRPLLKLTQSAQEMAAGNYAVALPAARHDEIGALTAAFGAMADKVRRHTEELESTVQERTQELLRTNQAMATAHQNISDSIAYASLIQRAILPDRQLLSALSSNYLVLWQPRDVVGGDFYIYHASGSGCLLGVVDCAGHGIPGAFMTMLARAAIDQAISDVGAADPAGILGRTDQAIRTMLHTDAKQHDIVTDMDAGLVYIDFAARRVTFAGARMALHWCDGSEVGIIKGARRAVGNRQAGKYHNEGTALQASRTFYLTTDGFLDQAGGDKGYGFGSARFVEMLRQHANRPLAEQRHAFASMLAAHQGDYPQRDDITLMCFRFA